MADMLPPEYQEQIDAALRKQRLAELLMAQGLRETPSGEMVSGHYIPANLLKQVGNQFRLKRGENMDADALAQISSTRRKYSDDATADLKRIQGITDETQQINEGMASKFGASQALAASLHKARLKRIEDMQKELGKRVGVDQVPQAYSGQVPAGGFQPKQKITMVDGLPVAVPDEYTPTAPKPQRVGAPWRVMDPSEAPKDSEGRPMAAQQSPLSGKIDVLDKAGKTNVRVSTGDTEDPYWKKVMTDLGEKDAARVAAGRDAPNALNTIGRIRELHVSSNGQYTAGPAEGPVRLIRDLASQAGIPLDPKIDLNNAKFQAEFANLIATQIIGQGRGLTDEDRKALQAAYPSGRITPAMLPAFLMQYENLVRQNAQFSNGVLQSLQQGRGAKAPTALRSNPPLPGMDEATKAKANALRKAAGLDPLP